MKIKRKKKKNNIVIKCAAVLLVLCACGGAAAGISKLAAPKEKNALAPIAEVSLITAPPEETVPELPEISGDEPEILSFRRPFTTDRTAEMDKNFVTANNSLLIDADTGEILGRHSSKLKIYPASMTKVMTLLVAVENLDNAQLSDTYPMTYELLAPLVEANASRVGFEVDEVVTVKDMLYGLILPSGADAAVGLCNYIAGSEENFVRLMNDKAEELGLTETHFMNSSGLHDKNHYTTCIEMSMIMKAAMNEPLCREILSTYTYTTSSTEQHPDGIVLYSNMFSRMYGTEVEGVTITSGKTGYTDEAGQCLVSYAEKGEHNYILVIAGDYERYQAVYSTFYAYENYLP